MDKDIMPRERKSCPFCEDKVKVIFRHFLLNRDFCGAVRDF